MVSTHICVEKELANGANHTNGIFIHIVVSLKSQDKSDIYTLCMCRTTWRCYIHAV